MKKTVIINSWALLLVVLLPLQKSYSQAEENQILKHEIKANALGLLVGFGEISYEYLLNEESTLGASLMASYDSNYFQKFGLSGAYRYYFGKGYAKGFFGEAFGLLNTVQDYEYTESVVNFPDGSSSYSYNYNEKDITDFALGMGIGYKLVSKRGVVLEFHGGVGRNIFDNSERDYQIIGRFGISAGYRF